MHLFHRISLPVLTLVSLSACGPEPQAPSESRVAPGAMNTAQNVESCVVVSSRRVQLTKPYGQPKQGQGAVAGAVAGGLTGNYLEKSKGVDDGSEWGAVIGAIVGSAVGTRLDSQANYAYGLELIVKTDRGESVVVTQGMAETDRPLNAGQSCLITRGGGISRVIAH